MVATAVQHDGPNHLEIWRLNRSGDTFVKFDINTERMALRSKVRPASPIYPQLEVIRAIVFEGSPFEGEHTHMPRSQHQHSKHTPMALLGGRAG